MDWTHAVDAYCERTDAGYWSEPVNALTNLAFVAGALWVWPRTAGQPLARGMAAVLFMIGVGSWLFHTHATVWASTADTLPILGFILVYIFAANRHVWGWPAWGAAVGMLAFVPYAALLTPVFARIPFVGISSFYWPVPLLIFGYAVLLRHRAPAFARGLAIGAVTLCLSLVFRSLDDLLCSVNPLGTHFMWHILNAVMLTWMIHVYLRHRLRHRVAPPS